MGEEERSDALAALTGHVWPDGLSVDSDGRILRVVATPVGRVEVAVVAGIALGIPAIVVLLFPTITGLVAAVLFVAVITGLGYQRFKGLQCVTVDVGTERIHVEHANPRAARRLGIGPGDVGFSDVAAVEVTRTMPAARTEPHGRRVSLRLHDGARLVLAEFTVAAMGLVFARAAGALLDAPIEER